MKIQYIKCPRCELNYIQKKDKFCEVCKQEMKAGSLGMDEFDEFEEDAVLCPVCKANYLSEGETICQFCQEEQSAFTNKDEDIDWKSEVEKSSSDEEEDMDLLPIEDNDDINEELQTAFSKDLDEDFMDDVEEDEEYNGHDDDDDFDASFQNDGFVDDEEDEDDYSDDDDDDFEY